jgi:N-carbamoyl-L-amino-acid hydrolase
MTLPQVKIDCTRLMAELDRLAGFSDAEPPAVTRVLFTPHDLAARAYLRELFAEAGLSVYEDPVGNIFARWFGQDSDLPTVATGSHTDAIPMAGRYDGTVGVLGALEAIRALKATGWEPAGAVELVMFTSEEPTRFGIGCLGSRLMSGALASDKAAVLRDQSGLTFEEVRRQAGCDGRLKNARLPSGYYAAFVELHIEQGPILDREGIPIGAVTAIAAPASIRVQIDGEGGHAGAVLMPGRKDALCAAAEVILAVEAAAKSPGGPDTVATAGVCRVLPGAINSIPARVTLEIDVRDIDPTTRDRVVEQIRALIEQSANRRGVRVQGEMLNADPPARAADEVVAAIQSACEQLKFPSKLMVSRAYHDSLFMARLCPTGMIFIPCKDGISHRPDEYSSPEAITRGAEVLALTLAQLAEAAKTAALTSSPVVA